MNTNPPVPTHTRWFRETLPRILPVEWKRLPDFSPYMLAFHKTVPPMLNVIVSGRIEEDDKRWLHVSVRRTDISQLPNWEIMRNVKNLFCGLTQKAVIVLPPEAEYVNIHPQVLHLFSCIDGDELPDFRVAEVDGLVSL